MPPRSIAEIDAATRGAVIRPSHYGRLFGLTPAGVAGQIDRGKLATIQIGGTRYVTCAPLRAALGLAPA